MTNGCFDLLHPGHVACLQEARRLGDCLLVAMNSDRSVEELKGPGHPIVDEQGRAEMLAALECVDYLVVFDEASVAGLVARVLPDVLVKGGQYSVEEIVGHEVVLARGGRVLPLPMRGRLLDHGADWKNPQPARPKADRRMKLAIFLPNWLGDLVMATPALRAVRRISVRRRNRRHPAAQAGRHCWPARIGSTRVAVRSARGQPDLRRRRWCGAMRRERFDLVLMLTNSLGTALLAWLGGARRARRIRSLRARRPC